MTKTNILMASLGSGGLATILGITSTVLRSYGAYGLGNDLFGIAAMIGLFGLVSGFVGYAYPVETGSTGTGGGVTSITKRRKVN